MQRNAIPFLLCPLFLVPLGGCATWHKIFGKKQAPQPTAADLSASADMDEPIAASYDRPAVRVEPPVREADPYAGYAPSESSSPMPVSSTRYHVVARHDTLYGLARLYYNNPRRWKDIYEANRSSIRDPNKIRVGQKLIIP